MTSADCQSARRMPSRPTPGSKAVTKSAGDKITSGTFIAGCKEFEVWQAVCCYLIFI
jgi:hypothetical protein